MLLRIYDTTNGKEIYEVSGTSNSVAWSPDGKQIARAPGFLEVIDATTGHTLRVYNEQFGVQAAINSIAWSPDGKYIASGNSEGTVEVFNAATKKLVTVYKGHTDIVNSITWSPDSKYIASGSQDKTVQVWVPV